MARHPLGVLAILYLLSLILNSPLRAEDATIQAPKAEKEIPIEKPQPRQEDSLDHLKRLFPEGKSSGTQEKSEAEPKIETESPFKEFIFQLKDYNWEQNVNLHIGNFTILGYREANSSDKMLFRFLTPEEHAEKRVMNSKASLLYSPPKKKALECGGSTPPSSARLDAPNGLSPCRVKPRR